MASEIGARDVVQIQVYPFASIANGDVATVAKFWCQTSVSPIERGVSCVIGKVTNIARNRWLIGLVPSNRFFQAVVVPIEHSSLKRFLVVLQFLKRTNSRIKLTEIEIHVHSVPSRGCIHDLRSQPLLRPRAASLLHLVRFGNTSREFSLFVQRLVTEVGESQGSSTLYDCHPRWGA